MKRQTYRFFVAPLIGDRLTPISQLKTIVLKSETGLNLAYQDDLSIWGFSPTFYKVEKDFVQSDNPIINRILKKLRHEPEQFEKTLRAIAEKTPVNKLEERLNVAAQENNFSVSKFSIVFADERINRESGYSSKNDNKYLGIY